MGTSAGVRKSRVDDVDDDVDDVDYGMVVMMDDVKSGVWSIS